MGLRAIVIGLDGAAPELLFGRWLDELPVLRALTERGRYGILRSCDPPITVPAWACMTSSRDPGAHGVYGFRNRGERSYAPLRFATSRSLRFPRVWDVLSARGRPVLVLGAPPAYPVTPVRGGMVSCFLAPELATHPKELAAELEAIVGRYLLDAPSFRSSDEDRLLADLDEVAAKRFRAAEHLLATRPWDLFFLVEIGSDRIQHRFWRYTDPTHILYEPGHRYGSAILDYYRRLDARIGRLLRFAEEGTAVLVVSDHGVKGNDGGVHVNEWLRREGYLVLRNEPNGPAPLVPELVDWARTTAWGEGGYYGRVFLNVAGREPSGTLSPSEYERVRDDIRRELEALGDEQGRPLGTVVHRPEDLYAKRNGIAPDLIAYFGDLRWRSFGEVGVGRVHRRESDGNDANHAHEGLYVFVADGVESGPGPVLDIHDVAPTLLALLGERAPRWMQGRSAVEPNGRW
ncbi:MAG: alkaline phosphatase family protein [Actinomycetota bacterium]|nr:alkaline phosphatase family protein [Actinomycetota bacterium]